MRTRLLSQVPVCPHRLGTSNNRPHKWIAGAVSGRLAGCCRSSASLSCSLRCLIVLALLLLLAVPARAWCDVLIYVDGGRERIVQGKLVARTDVELLFVLPDGQMIHLDDMSKLVKVQETSEPFVPVTREQMCKLLKQEFGPEFNVLMTPNYIICYNCRDEHARACGRLLENLHRAFTRYFMVRGFKLEEPQFPLVAIVFRTADEFRDYAKRELKESFHEEVIGFYSFLSNRVAMYDMPEWLSSHLHAAGGGVAGRRMRRDTLDAAVATIIHEAVHQLAYNTGFHRRFSENPLWLAEGLAMYFEAPTRRAGVWRGVGAVNRLRMPVFRDHYLVGRKRFDIASLVRDDERLRNPETAQLAYAEAWALTYYLLKNRRQQFCKYLEILRAKPPLGQDTPEQRLADFKEAFGPNFDKLAQAVIVYMRTLR